MNNYVYPLVIQSIISLYLVIRIVKEPSKTNLPQQSRGQSDENNGRPRARMPALSIREIASTKTIITRARIYMQMHIFSGTLFRSGNMWTS